MNLQNTSEMRRLAGQSRYGTVENANDDAVDTVVRETGCTAEDLKKIVVADFNLKNTTSPEARRAIGNERYGK